MEHLIFDNFKGYNLADEPSKLPTGALIKGSYNIDLTRQIGGLGKRLGTEAQITSLGAGGTKGLHNYRRSSGDVLLVAHGTGLNKLSGVPSTLTKSTTADFNAGTKDSNVSTASDELKLAITGAEIIDQHQDSYANTEAYPDSAYYFGQTFFPQVDAVTAISVYLSELDAMETVIVKLYDGVAKLNLLGTATLTGSSGTGWVKVPFPVPVPVTHVEHYFEVTGTSSGSLTFNMHYNYTGSDTYPSGHKYSNGVESSGNDWAFRIYGGNSLYTNGAWTSPVYDLGTTPVNASIAFNGTTPAGTSIVIKARGSEDGTVFGDWQSAASGAGIPPARFCQVDVSLNTNGVSAPILTDFTITTESAWTQATSIKSSLSGNKIRFKDYRDACYFCDGGRPQRYDGTTISNVGIDSPPAAPAVTSNGTGLTGTYKCAVQYVNKYGGKSKLSPVATITLTDQGLAWSAIATGPAGTTARNLYRTKAGGTAYYFVTALADNTTTTYTDTTADTNLITPYEECFIPPNATIIAEHKNYMLYVSADNPERLYFSLPKEPDNIGGSNGLATGYKGFPGAIKGVATYQDACIVSGDQFTKAVIGDLWDKDPTINATSIRNISNEYGTLSHEAMVECFSPDGDILIFPTRLGLNYVTPGLQENSMRSIPLSKDVQPIFDQAINKANMAAIFDKGRYILALNWNGTDIPVATNNIILVYDLRTGQWNPPWYLSASGFAESRGRVFFGSSNIGQIYELGKGTSDDGAAIHSVANLRPFTSNKGLKMMGLRVAAAEGSNTATVEVKPVMDGVSETVTPGAFTGVSNRKRMDLPKGHKGSCSIEDNSTNDWIITELDIEYLVRGR